MPIGPIETAIMLAEGAIEAMAKRLFIALVLAVTSWVAAGQPAFGAARALFVGVEEYANPSHNLKGVKEDVKMFKEVLFRTGVLSEPETRTLLDKEATKANVVKTFQEWLIRGSAPGDTVLFYFSGHGIQIWDTNGDEQQDGRDEALMCWDSNATGQQEVREFLGRRGTAFPPANVRNFLLDDEIHDLLAQLQGRNILFFSDSCHSGSVYKRINPYFVQNKTLSVPVSYKSVFDPRMSTGSGKEPPRESTNIGGDLMADGLRIACFTASEDSQPAQIVNFDKDPKGIHSVFTWYLANGLSGRADYDKDGKITLGELGRYLEAEVKRDGFAQIPQHEFRPKDLETAVVSQDGLGPPPAPPTKTDSTKIACTMKGDATLSDDEKQRIKSSLSGNLPFVEWTDDLNRVTCLIEASKQGNVYGLRLSDSTGAYWEPHQDASLETALNAVAGDLKALYVQEKIASLQNLHTKMRLDLDYELKSSSPRPPGEVVAGDTIVFRARAQTPGYLYIFSVDTCGVIHPLYPGPDGNPSLLKANEEVTIGSDGAFVVEPPFGRETIFAILAATPSQSLAPYWRHNDIGDTNKPGITQQSQFLGTLRRELTQSGKPAGEWVSKRWPLKSFKSATE